MKDAEKYQPNPVSLVAISHAANKFSIELGLEIYVVSSGYGFTKSLLHIDLTGPIFHSAESVDSSIEEVAKNLSWGTGPLDDKYVEVLRVIDREP